MRKRKGLKAQMRDWNHATRQIRVAAERARAVPEPDNRVSFEKYAAHRPRVGDVVVYRGTERREIVRVEGNLCWTRYDDGEALPFIWCFKDGLNLLHDWPGKEG